MAKGKVHSVVQTNSRRNIRYPWEFKSAFTQFQVRQPHLNLVAYPTRHNKKKPSRKAKGFSTISISS